MGAWLTTPDEFHGAWPCVEFTKPHLHCKETTLYYTLHRYRLMRTWAELIIIVGNNCCNKRQSNFKLDKQEQQKPTAMKATTGNRKSASDVVVCPVQSSLEKQNSKISISSLSHCPRSLIYIINVVLHPPYFPKLCHYSLSVRYTFSAWYKNMLNCLRLMTLIAKACWDDLLPSARQ